MVVLDSGLGTLPESPPRLAHAPAEVDVAGRADPLGEPPELVEGPAADQQVAGRRGDPRRAVHALGLVEEVAIAGVAGEQRVLLDDPDDPPGDRAAARVDRLGEVALEQVGHRDAVGVAEQQPLAGGPLGPGVAREVGGALRGRVHDPRQPLERRRGDALLGVVGDDQLVRLTVSSGANPSRVRSA